MFKRYINMRMIFLFLLLSILVSSCKKPKDGRYFLQFTEDSGNKTEYNILLDRKKETIKVLPEKNAYGISGELKIKDNAVEGEINFAYQGLASSDKKNYRLNGNYSKNNIT